MAPGREGNMSTAPRGQGACRDRPLERRVTHSHNGRLGKQERRLRERKLNQYRVRPQLASR